MSKKTRKIHGGKIRAMTTLGMFAVVQITALPKAGGTEGSCAAPMPTSQAPVQAPSTQPAAVTAAPVQMPVPIVPILPSVPNTPIVPTPGVVPTDINNLQTLPQVFITKPNLDENGYDPAAGAYDAATYDGAYDYTSYLNELKAEGAKLKEEQAKIEKQMEELWQAMHAISGGEWEYRGPMLGMVLVNARLLDADASKRINSLARERNSLQMRLNALSIPIQNNEKNIRYYSSLMSPTINPTSTSTETSKEGSSTVSTSSVSPGSSSSTTTTTTTNTTGTANTAADGSATTVTVQCTPTQTANSDYTLQVPDHLAQIFDVVDRNGDGTLTRNEILRELRNDHVDASAILSLLTAFDQLSELDSGNGISRNDIKALTELNANVNYIQNVLGRIKEFNLIDSNSDGELSREELQVARDSQPNNRQIFDALINNYDYIRSNQDQWGFDSGISRADLEFTGVGTRTGALWSQLEEAESMAAAAQQYPRDLWGGKTPRESINPNAVVQGEIGDCFFLAAVASLAAVSPSSIERLIKDNGDGTYTVTFPNRAPVTVHTPSVAEMARYGGSPSGTWVVVLETAYGQIQDNSWHDRANVISFGGRDNPTEHLDEGGSASMGLELLTSHTSNHLLTLTPLPTTRNLIINGIREGRPMIAGSEREFTEVPLIGARNPLSDGRTDTGGLESNHVFSVIGYDSATDSVILRNPYGTNTDKDMDPRYVNAQTGVFSMPMGEFMSAFNTLTMGDAPPSAPPTASGTSGRSDATTTSSVSSNK